MDWRTASCYASEPPPTPRLTLIHTQTHTHCFLLDQQRPSVHKYSINPPLLLFPPPLPRRLLSTIKPGLVKKINRLPTPIAGLVRTCPLTRCDHQPHHPSRLRQSLNAPLLLLQDNLSVFLRGCEELGLRGAQLFDPGDLQDTSIRANLK